MGSEMRYHSAPVEDIGKYIDDDEWFMEQKLDGVRCMVTVDEAGNVSFSTQAGTKHHEAIADELGALCQMTVDGELMGVGNLWLFDITMLNGNDLGGMPYEQRRRLLSALASECDHVNAVPVACSREEKADLWERVVKSGGEGVIVKRSDAGYLPGSRTRSMLKVKITHTVDCIVTGFDRATGSALLSVVDARLLVDRLVDIGKVSTHAFPEALSIGNIVEVRCLYATDEPRLYQPHLLRIRHDKKPDQCGIEQLEGCLTTKGVLT